MDNNWMGNNPFLGQNNPFLQQRIDDASGDVVRNYNLAVKPNTESSMVNSGSFGNSGLAQLQAEQQRQLQSNLGRLSNDMRMQDYGQQQQMYQWDQGFNRGLFNDAFDQNQRMFENNMGLLGMENQFNAADINSANYMQNAPLTYQQQFGQMANSAGGLGGSAGGSTTQSSNPWLGAIGGWGLGGRVF